MKYLLIVLMLMCGVGAEAKTIHHIKYNASGGEAIYYSDGTFEEISYGEWITGNDTVYSGLDSGIFNPDWFQLPVELPIEEPKPIARIDTCWECQEGWELQEMFTTRYPLDSLWCERTILLCVLGCLDPTYPTMRLDTVYVEAPQPGVPLTDEEIRRLRELITPMVDTIQLEYIRGHILDSIKVRNK